MKLSEKESIVFLSNLGVDEPVGIPSVRLLNDIVKQFTINVPWQNLSMILSGFGEIPRWLDIKRRIFDKIGGICLDNNRFVYNLLLAQGFDVQYVLCRRPTKEKTHLALVVQIEKCNYFVDCGDAQPYFEAFNLESRNIFKGKSVDFKVDFKNGYYQLYRKRNQDWKLYYEFDLSIVSDDEIYELIIKYYSNIFFGPFWKQVHFASYPEQKLVAIRNQTIIKEQNDGHVNENDFFSFDEFIQSLRSTLSIKVYNKYDFQEAFELLQFINLEQRFGLILSTDEIDLFLRRLEVIPEYNSIDFVNKLITRLISKVPFQNQCMHSRGFGKVPIAEHIKDDMINLRGGTCGTMNIFFGALLYSLGYDTSLINGRMQKKDDHIGILLKLNNCNYVIDVGDGQPFFKAFPCWKDISVPTAFRTFRTVARDSELEIQFLINNRWVTDSVFNLTPRPYKVIQNTLNYHYRDQEFGPFWKGVRFALYPEKRIIALRDKTFYYQTENGKIDKTEIETQIQLELILNKYLKAYKDTIIKSYNSLQLL